MSKLEHLKSIQKDLSSRNHYEPGIESEVSRIKSTLDSLLDLLIEEESSIQNKEDIAKELRELAP